MAATVFFSWQADTPNSVGRNFVRKALEDACARIASDATVDEAHRDLEVDSDTQAICGMCAGLDATNWMRLQRLRSARSNAKH
jgi:hypothetical protein